MNGEHPALRLSDAIAEQLADPGTVPAPATSQAWWGQSLAHGVPGIALLHIERAALGRGPWQYAHDWLSRATDTALTTGADSYPFHGAPALAHVLTCATAVHPTGYGRALERLDAAITRETVRRVDAAHSRIDTGRPASMTEFDTFRGLAGVGAYLLRRDRTGATLRSVLSYLVRLSEPLSDPDTGRPVPGWWTTCGPNGRPDEAFPGGHAGCGMAHGIAGPLTVLSLATRAGVTVPGQHEAITRICSWFDRWSIDTGHGRAWPYWVTHPQFRSGAAPTREVRRPSWCYGTGGVARAQQLAALATDQPARRAMAENALIEALTDPAQRQATTDSSLCHGFAGLAHLATRMANEAAPGHARQLRTLIPDLLEAAQEPGADPRRSAAALLGTTGRGPDGGGPALLEGAAGIALALLSPTTDQAPQTGWDSCLLLA